MILLNVVGKNLLYNYAAFVIYTDQQRPVNWRLLESLCPLKYSFLQWLCNITKYEREREKKSNKNSLAYKLPSGHMPDSRTILNSTVFSHLSQINTISLDLAYTWFSHLTWSCHVHLLCIHDSPHMKPSFVFLEVLNYYITISFQLGQCQVWRVPVI